MLNRVTIMGRLAKDPELRRTGQGTAVASLSIAVERDIAPQGQQKETDFFDCVAWRNTAEFIAKYFTKGRMIVVDGKLQTRSWNDRDGNKRKSVEILVDSAYFGDSKTEGNSYGTAPAYSYGAWGGCAPAAPASDYAVMEDDDPQLPY